MPEPANDLSVPIHDLPRLMVTAGQPFTSQPQLPRVLDTIIVP